MLWFYLLLPIILIGYFALRVIFYRYPVKKRIEILHREYKKYQLMWAIGFGIILLIAVYIIWVILRLSERMFWDDWILLPALTLIVLVFWNRLDFIFNTKVEKKPPFFLKK